MENKEIIEVTKDVADFSEELSNYLSRNIEEFTDTIEDDNAASIAICVLYTNIGAFMFAQGAVISEKFFNDFEYPKEKLETCLNEVRKKIKEKINQKG